MRRMRSLAALVAVLVVGGCGGSVDRLGQPADATVTLSGLSAQGLDEVGAYATTVEQLSGGKLRVAIEVADGSAVGHGAGRRREGAVGRGRHRLRRRARLAG